MLPGPCPAIDVIPGICLRNEHISFRIYCQSIKQCSESIHSPDEAVGPRIKDIEIPVWNTRVLDDIGHVPEGEHVVVGDRVLMGIEGYQVTIQLVAPGKLGLVVGFERNNIE